MYISVDLRLTEEQMKLIEEQVKVELTNAIAEGKLKHIVADVVRKQIKQLVMEDIQTKDYRAFISEKVQEVLMDNKLYKEN